MKEQKGYKCDFCSKMSSNAGAMAIHEHRCKKNPINIPMCDNCQWLDWHHADPEDVKVTVVPQHYDPYSGYIEAEVANYKVDVRYCLYYGKLFHKFNKQLKEELEARGWMKMPTKDKGCIHHLSDETAADIKKWALGHKEIAGLSSDIHWYHEITVTPELAFKYFVAIDDFENVKRFQPRKDNDGWSNLSEKETLMNPKPSGLPIHDIVN